MIWSKECDHCTEAWIITARLRFCRGGNCHFAPCYVFASARSRIPTVAKTHKSCTLDVKVYTWPCLPHEDASEEEQLDTNLSSQFSPFSAHRWEHTLNSRRFQQEQTGLNELKCCESAKYVRRGKSRRSLGGTEASWEINETRYKLVYITSHLRRQTLAASRRQRVLHMSTCVNTCGLLGLGFPENQLAAKLDKQVLEFWGKLALASLLLSVNIS